MKKNRTNIHGMFKDVKNSLWVSSAIYTSTDCELNLFSSTKKKKKVYINVNYQEKTRIFQMKGTDITNLRRLEITTRDYKKAFFFLCCVSCCTIRSMKQAHIKMDYKHTNKMSMNECVCICLCDVLV